MSAGDIAGVDFEIECRSDFVNKSEYVVRMSVPAPPIPPAFDHTFVVTPELILFSCSCLSGDNEDKEVESDCLGPTNVPFSIFSFPSWEEAVCSPETFDIQANTIAAAGVRVPMDVNEICGSWNG